MLPGEGGAIKPLGDVLENLSGEFDQLRAGYAQVYKVDPKFAGSFVGTLLKSAGQLVPQTVAAMVPYAGVAALQGQAFQYGWEDAQEAAKRNGRPFDPDRAFGYAFTTGLTSALLNKIRVTKALEPWIQGGGEKTLAAGLFKVFKATAVSGATAPVQGAISDELANLWGIDQRNPLDLEKRGKEFALGFLTSAGLSGFAAGAKVMVDRPAPVTSYSKVIDRSKSYPFYKLQSLAKYLERRGVVVHSTIWYPHFDVGENMQPTMYLNANSSTLAVLHELSHYLDYRRLGLTKYIALGRRGRELSVLRRLQNNRIWDTFDDITKRSSEEYANHAKN